MDDRARLGLSNEPPIVQPSSNRLEEQYLKDIAHIMYSPAILHIFVQTPHLRSTRIL